nr:TadE/TadG family type IV pilus assembly protein [Propylenella binzhouense]
MRRLLAFLRREDGNVAMIFAFTVIPIMGLMGFAVDYTRASDARTQLQTALDSVALAAAKSSNDMTDAEIRQMVETRLAKIAPEKDYNYKVEKVTRDKGTVRIEASGQLDTVISGVLGINLIDISASSEATWSTGKMEIALVIDDTGSMNQNNKLVQLKKAAGALIDAVGTSDPDDVKLGIVPFNTQVKLPTSYSSNSWIMFKPSCSFLDLLFGRCKNQDLSSQSSWQGCLADRGDNPYTTNVSGKDYDTNDTQGSGDAYKYPAVSCAYSTLPEIVPLNTNLEAVRAKINNMAADGNTNITIGLAWGLSMLSPDAPLTEGVAWGTKDLTKVLILITDGENTQNRWTSDTSKIDQRTKLACTAVKGQKIVLYTVRLQDGNASLLSQCASNGDTYFNVENVNDLVPTFKAIGEQLSDLRISK